jgi:hypothetical protein
MSSSKVPISLIYKNEIKFILSNALKVLTIQILFNITTSVIYLQDFTGLNYFPNFQGEFLDINQDILTIQPAIGEIKLETIVLNCSDARFLFTTGNYYFSDMLTTGYNIQYKNARRSLVRFDNLTSLNGKKVVRAYLKIFGSPKCDTCTADPKEIFVHRIDENYTDILKWTDIPSYNPRPETSIMVGETNLLMFYWDITSLVRSWVDKPNQNFGVLLKQDDPIGQENVKLFYRTSKPPQLKVIYLSS